MSLTAALPSVRPARIHRRHPLLRIIGENNILDNFTPEAFEKDLIEQRTVFVSTFLINKPSLVKHILIDNSPNYARTQASQSIFKPVMGSGLFANDGPSWKRHRRIVAPVLQPRSLENYTEIMRDVLASTIERWRTFEPGHTVDLSAELIQLSLQIIAKSMASVDSDVIVQPMARGVADYLARARIGFADVWGLPAWVPRLGKNHRIAARAFREFDTALQKLIDARMGDRRAGPADLLTQLMATLDSADPLTRREIRDEIINIFLTGHETTSATIGWMLYLLCLHPEAERRVHEEVASAAAAGLASDSDLSHLPYTEMVLQETLRLYPAGYSIARQALGEDQIDGHRVRKGSRMLVLPWVLHRHRKHWRYPDRFWPAHFEPDAAAARSRFVYIPFGIGPRMCVGAHFAMKEMAMTVTALLQHFKFELDTGQVVRPYAFLGLRPKTGIRMRIFPRQAGPAA
ncbi:MAG TPA: cytochrome P450 [Micropepsaceae bacterium]|nr:cytochrome P450 [Micropepsaceae bacterium]